MALPFAGWLCLGYLTFVTYGSLVPFDFRAIPLDAAWRSFANIPFLILGIESRADWIANGVLYVPTGFLLCAALRAPPLIFGRVAAALIAAVAALSLAVSVEFAQLYFPPRTVSLNDLLAEAIGAALGIALAITLSDRVGTLVRSVMERAGPLATHLLDAYVVAFFLLSLFPYDFVISWPELQAKLASGRVGWFTAIGGPGQDFGSAGLARPLVEALVAFPVGLAFARRTGAGLIGAAAAGALVGATVECIQLFVASGFSQGVSVLTRCVAFVLAALAWRQRARTPVPALARGIARLGPVWLPVYLLGLLAASGLLRGDWSAEAAGRTLGELRFLPFYYHYFTSEAKALNSVLGIGAMYLPLGVWCWARGTRANGALLLAAGGALCVEAAKLFAPGLRPDPTNLLIAVLAAWAVAALLNRLFPVAPSTQLPGPSGTVVAAPAGMEDREPATPPATVTLRAWATMGLAARLPLFAALLFALPFLAGFPLLVVPLGLVASLVAVALWRRPWWVFGLVPAAIPVLDLAHWSGRFFADEIDLLLAIGVAIGFARLPPRTRRSRDPAQAVAVLAVSLAYLMGAAHGAWPLSWPDANAFNNYFSPWNALRIAKGAAWAFLLWRLQARLDAAGIRAEASFGAGMLIGLAWTAAVIVAERLAFASLLDFASDYRVTGPFSQMHTGGAYVECYIAAATPFVLAAILRARVPVTRAALIALLAAAAYALMMTFSRGGYAAFALGVTLTLWLALARGLRGRSGTGHWLPALAVALVALPVLIAPFARQRIASTGTDFQVREAHWNDALEMIPGGLLDRLVGVGLGRYPETHHWKSAEAARPALFRVELEGDNPFLRMGAGKALYVDQIVSIDATRRQVLNARVRSAAPGAAMAVSLCRKWIYTSAECVDRELRLDGPAGQWQSLRVEFPPAPALEGWPVKLSLHAPSGRAAVDLDDLSLTDANGAERVANGTFSRGMDRWFFSNDEHLSWHVKNLPVALLFDLGWLGVCAVGALIALALWRSARRAWAGDLAMGAVFAALSGFLVIGAIDSLVDTPRFLLLFLLLALVASRRPVSARSPSPPDPQ